MSYTVTWSLVIAVLTIFVTAAVIAAAVAAPVVLVWGLTRLIVRVRQRIVHRPHRRHQNVATQSLAGSDFHIVRRSGNATAKTDRADLG
jgi:hypothetical protein